LPNVTERKTIASTHEDLKNPLHWQEILSRATDSSELPFEALYLDALLEAFCAPETPAPIEIDLDLDDVVELVAVEPIDENECELAGPGWATVDRIVEPVEGWEHFLEGPPLEAVASPPPTPHEQGSWEVNSEFIEEWFDEGEALQFSEAEVEIDEPDRLERTLQWFRSLFIATNLRHA
jgi:hypothetical protein